VCPTYSPGEGGVAFCNSCVILSKGASRAPSKFASVCWGSAVCGQRRDLRVRPFVAPDVQRRRHALFSCGAARYFGSGQCNSAYAVQRGHRTCARAGAARGACPRHPPAGVAICCGAH